MNSLQTTELRLLIFLKIDLVHVGLIKFESTMNRAVVNNETRTKKNQQRHICHLNDPKFSHRQTWTNSVDPDQCAGTV